MKKFAFISDFDGTLTDKDFYQIIIDKYLGNEGKNLYKKWRANEMLDIDFLGDIYKSIDRDERGILDDILSIPLDPDAKRFINAVINNGGDFIVLSAGTSYYIDRLFEHQNISVTKIYSNCGIFKNNGIHLQIDRSSEFYSERYGIDKGKVISSLRDKYETIYFAGDSGPDIVPSKYADVVFAKNSLKKMLAEINIQYIPFNCYREIYENLHERGVF